MLFSDSDDASFLASSASNNSTATPPENVNEYNNEYNNNNEYNKNNDVMNEDEDKNRQIMMSVLFSTLMVLYIAFCCYYRKRKAWNSVTDEPRSRRQLRLDNQAVMDESSNAITRARENEEELRKLEERKERIRRALFLRLIVDHDYDQDHDDKTGEDLLLLCDSCEGNAIHRDGEQTASASASVAVAMESSSSAGTASLPSLSSLPQSPSNNTMALTVATSSATLPPTMASPSAASPTCTNFKKYADALQASLNSCQLKHGASSIIDCGSNGHGNSNNNSNTNSNSNSNTTTSMANCSNHSCSNYFRSANYGSSNNNNTTNNNNSGSSKHKNNKNDNGDSNTIISLSTIIQLYGEECNICLSSFQVGDRAAWSKHATGGGNGNGNGNGGNGEGCMHAFHDECISRWLSVRDGCPICRRSYLLEKDDDDNDDNNDDEGNLNDATATTAADDDDINDDINIEVEDAIMGASTMDATVNDSNRNVDRGSDGNVAANYGIDDVHDVDGVVQCDLESGEGGASIINGGNSMDGIVGVDNDNAIHGCSSGGGGGRGAYNSRLIVESGRATAGMVIAVEE